MIFKDFDTWNRRKQEINKTKLQVVPFYNAGEIWWCGLGVNIGVETDGKNDNFERPVLIIKKFNADMVWVLPITSVNKGSKFYYHINYGDEDRWVALSQIRTISTKRLFRKVDILPESDFRAIQNLIIGFIKSETPPKGGESRSPKGH